MTIKEKYRKVSIVNRANVGDIEIVLSYDFIAFYFSDPSKYIKLPTVRTDDSVIIKTHENSAIGSLRVDELWKYDKIKPTIVELVHSKYDEDTEVIFDSEDSNYECDLTDVGKKAFKKYLEKYSSLEVVPQPTEMQHCILGIKTYLSHCPYGRKLSDKNAEIFLSTIRLLSAIVYNY